MLCLRMIQDLLIALILNNTLIPLRKFKYQLMRLNRGSTRPSWRELRGEKRFNRKKWIRIKQDPKHSQNQKMKFKSLTKMKRTTLSNLQELMLTHLEMRLEPLAKKMQHL